MTTDVVISLSGCHAAIAMWHLKAGEGSSHQINNYDEQQQMSLLHCVVVIAVSSCCDCCHAMV
jgi:hypothetical protein